MPEPIYLGDALDKLISDALLFYAEHNGDLSANDREDAMTWHHALTNDTFLLQTTVDPKEETNYV